MAKAGGRAADDQQAIYQKREVPQFDGTLSRWKEYEKRATMFMAKLTLEKKEGEAALMLSAGMTGEAWDEVEDFTADDLIKPGAATALLTRLRKRFQMDARTELADDFEEYFYKLRHNRGETLFGYISRVRAAERKLKTPDIELPSKVRGWLIIRRGGYSPDQKAVIMSLVGKDITQDKVIEALETTYGQESTVYEPNHARKQYHVDDDIG
eukprot:848240-Pyramimonas_sp.AAC.1